MIQIIINLPEALRLELAVHACACNLTIPKLLVQCAESLVANGRPAGWEDLSTEDEAQALRAANINPTPA